jgi:hypothetical protein
MRVSGKVNKYCQLPSSRIFSRNLSRKILRVLTSGKDARAREKLIKLVYSRDLASFPVTYSRNISVKCLGSLLSGKDARARELTNFINFSRVSHLFPSINSRNVSARCLGSYSRVKMRELGSWQYLLTFPESRIFSRNQLPRNFTTSLGFTQVLTTGISREWLREYPGRLKLRDQLPIPASFPENTPETF